MATRSANRIKKNKLPPLPTDEISASSTISKLRKVTSEEEALEEIQTEEFYNTLKSYYTHRDGEEGEFTTRGFNKFSEMSHADLLEYFYNDRSWRNNNTGAMTKDLANAFTDSADRNAQLGYISATYHALPSFWDDPNRSFGSWLYDNGGAMIADPVNLISFGIGGQAAKVAYKAALNEALKGKIAGQITKEALEAQVKMEANKAMGKAVMKGALVEGKIGAVVATAQDTMLQLTEIKTGVTDEFSLKRSAIATGAGFGFGTVFGGAFSYGGFKLGIRGSKNTAVKNLKDIHEYGRSEITGKQLFQDLAEPKPDKALYKNLDKNTVDNIARESSLTGRTIDEKIGNLRISRSIGKSPEEELNLYKYPANVRPHLKNLADQMVKDGKILNDEVTEKYAIKQAAIIGLNPDAVIALGKSRAINDRLLYAEILAHGDLLAKQSEDIIKLSNQLHVLNISPADEAKVLKELEIRQNIAGETLKNQKEITKNIARSMRFMQLNKDTARAAELKLNPEDPTMATLKTGNPKEFYKAIAKLHDTDQVIVALQNARKVNGWDLTSEFINNNLLSSPDTHAINLISGLFQTQWKPLTMLVRAAFLAPQDSKRANELAKEAFDTYIHHFLYTKDALMAAKRSFVEGRGILDSKQMKFDNNIRQGQLQRWLQETSRLLTDRMGTVGVGLDKYVFRPLGYATTFPMRILSAGDEFLKTMTYKARVASQVNTLIREETGKGFWKGVIKEDDYKARFKELEADYQKSASGGALETADMTSTSIKDVNRLKENDPLQTARESTYTESSYSRDPVTGKMEGGITGSVLSFTSKHRWSRALGLHFINTPSNLIKWNFQHLPILNRLVLSTRHALKKGADGKYLNVEAAAEANARATMGAVLWTGAFALVSAGKITGGGSRNYRENAEREINTGWKPYSYKTADGRYVQLNRADPVMMPFFIMADLQDSMNKFLRYNEDIPEAVEKDMTELSMGVLTSLFRNLNSKFYMKNIVETANMFFSDDFVSTRSPDRIGASVLARALYKITPLSGGLRYASRVDEDYQKELFTLNDRLLAIQPWKGTDSIMPKRNMYGEVIDRDRGWLFGLGRKSGLWSSPFAMTKTENPMIQKFYENRDFDYRPPSKIDRKSGVDLRTIKNAKDQTAYDRWRELTGQVTLPYKGQRLTLKKLIETVIQDPKSKLYKKADGTIAGVDERQKFILEFVHKAEAKAKKQLLKEFTNIKDMRKNRKLIKRNAKKRAKKNYIEILTQ
jgi:(2Fe-2S) ferredoxin